MTEDELVSEILARCRERSERGEAIDTETIVRAHPELAERLQARFDVLRVLERAYPGRKVPEGSSFGDKLAGESLGPYRLLEPIGSGGMGSVWRAVVEGKAAGIEPRRTVALKLLHPHLFTSPGFFKRFLREAQVGKAVVHDNVVRTYDADAVRIGAQDHHFLVMEYVEGQTLRGLLRELDNVPEELCRHIGREVAKGLAAIHAAGIVHRDMKPENVLITKEHVVKVMDLGVARLADEAVRLSQTGAFVGSIQYAAPEQFAKGGEEVDARADLHALGLILYELSCGIHPYLADDVAQIVERVLHEEPRRLGEVNPQISPFFEEVVHCLLQKDREKRFPSAQALVEVLEGGEERTWWKERAKALRIRTRRPLRRIRIPRETAVYGREPEIAKLRSLFEKAKGGEGQVALIEGEAGIGKSRVVDELIGRLLQEGADLSFLHGSYAPGGAATAAGAFSTAYREQFGEAGSCEHLTRIPLLVPAFDALLNGDATPTGTEPLTKDSLQACFVHATRALAAERTTVVLIDDLHFAPEEGRALFASLALAVPGHRVLLVGTTRPGVPEVWQAGVTRLEQTSQTVLARLGPKELVRLLEDAFHSKALASELVARIALKSDGNPFFVFEIIRGLREGQFIARRDDGTWVSTGVIDEIKIPSSVLDLVNARVAGLTQEERDLVDVACCWGFEFDPLLVGAVVGLERIPVLKLLSLIERKHRIVRSAGQRFVFDHHQVQEALYQGLPEMLRQEYHSALAAALETREKAAERDPATLPGGMCVDLCEHFLRGARVAQALRYLAAALTHLETGYLNAAAAALAERILAAPDLVTGTGRAKLLLRLADRLDFLGRSERQIVACREAEEIARAVGDEVLRGKAAQLLGGAFFRVSDFPAAKGALSRAQEIGKRLGDKELEASAARSLGSVFWNEGRLRDARGQFERSLELSRECGDRSGEAGATVNLGIVLGSEGRVPEAENCLERGAALAREAGNRRFEANAAISLGRVFEGAGRLAEAREHHERSLALAREIGYQQGEANATGNLSSVFCGLGRFTEAREHCERWLALAREIGNRQGEADAIRGLGNVLCSLGRLAEARKHQERSLALARELGYRQGEAAAMGNLGNVLCFLGGFAEAREHCERCLALAQQMGDSRRESHALRSLADLAAEEGDAAAAERCLAEALELRRATGSRDDEADTLRARGTLFAQFGRSDDARASFGEALAIAREIPLPDVELLATAELARLPGGDAAAALAALAAHEGRVTIATAMNARVLLWQATHDHAHLAEAKRLLDHVVEHAPEDCRESMLGNVRLHREIAAAWNERSAAG